MSPRYGAIFLEAGPFLAGETFDLFLEGDGDLFRFGDVAAVLRRFLRPSGESFSFLFYI